jgi:hypothetical protein
MKQGLRFDDLEEAGFVAREEHIWRIICKCFEKKNESRNLDSCIAE